MPRLVGCCREGGVEGRGNIVEVFGKSGVYGVETYAMISFNERLCKFSVYSKESRTFRYCRPGVAILKHSLEMRRKALTYLSYD